MLLFICFQMLYTGQLAKANIAYKTMVTVLETYFKCNALEHVGCRWD